MNKKLVAVIITSLAMTHSLQPLLAMEVYEETTKIEEVDSVEINSIEIENEKVGEIVAAADKQQVQAARANIYNLRSAENYEAYVKAYRIDGIKSYTNNGDRYMDSYLSYIFDDNLNTHWETGTENTEDFKNEITVTFDKIEEIGQIAYAARQDIWPKGYPKKVAIYSSLSENEEDFELVAVSETQPTSKEVIYQIEPTQFKRLKFVFEEAHFGWASCAELSFFREDEFLNRFSELFEDETYSALSKKAKQGDFFKETKALYEAHPLKSFFEYEMNLAQTLYDNEDALSDAYILVASQRGDEGREQDEHDIARISYSLDSYGKYALPGETIRVFVDADKQGTMPILVVGQGKVTGNSWGRKEYELAAGMNVITMPQDANLLPGVLYIRNPASSEDQAYAPRVRIEGGHEYPVYRHGEMTPEEYNKELEAYCAKVEEDPSTYADITELVSENNTILLKALDSLKGVQDMEELGVDVSDTMDEWEEMWKQFQIYSGFIEGDENPKHDYYPAKYMSVSTTGSDYGGWSTYAYCAFNVNSRTLIKPITLNGEDWVIFHEWGHSINNRSTEIVEVTNNQFAAYMRRLWKLGGGWDDVNWHSLYNIVTGGKADKDNLFVQLSMLHQIEFYFGEDIYGKMSSIARENKNGLLDGLDNNSQKYVVAMSHATGYDLTDFFDAYDYIKSTDLMKQKVASLKKLDVKLNYMHKSAYGYTGNGFTKDAMPEITSIQYNGSGNNEIRFGIDQKNKDALMGYEVYRDGKLIAYTVDTNKYIDTNVEAGKNYEYSIVAYDKKLNASQKVTKQSLSPTLSVEREITVKVGEKFDEKAYATAETSLKEDISDAIKVVASDVDTSKVGNYTVTYQLTSGQDVIQKTAKVKVVEDYMYLSDVDPVSAKVGWGAFEKDLSPNKKPVTLYREGLSATYPKGLGAHAHSELIYDLTKEGLSGYDYFEAYIGIDQEMRNNTNSSVIFEVWVDNKRLYESDVFYGDSEHGTVCIPITGAKELKLVVTDANIQTYWGDYSEWAMARLTKSPIIEEDNNANDKEETNPDHVGDNTGDAENGSEDGSSGDSGNPGEDGSSGDSGNPGEGGSSEGSGSTGGSGNQGEGGSTGSSGNQGTGGNSGGSGNQGTGDNSGNSGNQGNASKPESGSSTSQFEDVKGHWAENAIAFVVERNIFKGTSANKFEPNMTITRGMFVTLLGRVANIEPSDYKQSSFNDVPNAAYYMPYVEWAKGKGIVNGVSATKYAPNDLVTREQMAVMLENFAKAYGITLPEIEESKTFTDASEIASWSKSAACTMQKAGIITGKTGNRFDPKGKAIRAEGAAVLQRFIQATENNNKK